MKVIPAEKSNAAVQQEPNAQFVNMSVNLKQASSAAGSGAVALGNVYFISSDSDEYGNDFRRNEDLQNV